MKKIVICAILAMLLALTAACGAESKVTSPTEPEAQTAQPQQAVKPTAAACVPPETPCVLLDRNGAEFELSYYPELEGARAAFGEYLDAESTVQLTVNIKMQDDVRAIMEESLDGASGVAVVVDLETGAPLVMVSVGGETDAALENAYQPQSLFMPCTAIAALDTVATVDYTLDCLGVYDKYAQEGAAPECWIWDEGYTHPEENVITALRDACQYYFYSVANDMGIDELTKYAESFGLGQPTGIELSENLGVAGGRDTATAENNTWNIGDTLEAAVGRGYYAFTPLQMAEYCAAIASDGVRHSASILKSVSSGGSAVYERENTELSRVEKASSEIWDAVQEGMYDALNSPINAANFEIWSDCVCHVAGMPYMTDENCIFMGYGPYEAPQIAVFVAVEQPDALVLTQTIAREIFGMIQTQN